MQGSIIFPPSRLENAPAEPRVLISDPSAQIYQSHRSCKRVFGPSRLVIEFKRAKVATMVFSDGLAPVDATPEGKRALENLPKALASGPLGKQTRCEVHCLFKRKAGAFSAFPGRGCAAGRKKTGPRRDVPFSVARAHKDS